MSDRHTAARSSTARSSAAHGRPGRDVRRCRCRRPLGALRDAGTATAEYAVAMLAACGFAGLLLVILRSSEVRGLLTGIIRRALAVG